MCIQIYTRTHASKHTHSTIKQTDEKEISRLYMYIYSVRNSQLITKVCSEVPLMKPEQPVNRFYMTLNTSINIAEGVALVIKHFISHSINHTYSNY